MSIKFCNCSLTSAVIQLVLPLGLGIILLVHGYRKSIFVLKIIRELEERQKYGTIYNRRSLQNSAYNIFFKFE